MLEICKLSLENNIPVYTGAVKSNLFHKHILPEWKPDAILMFGFGQLLDRQIWSYPCYGTYNFHPSNLLLGEGRGADPFFEVISEHRDEVIISVHQVDDTLDGGHVVGISSGVNIRKENPPDERMSMPEIMEAVGFSGHKMLIPMVVELQRLKKLKAPRQLIGSLHFQ